MNSLSANLRKNTTGLTTKNILKLNMPIFGTQVGNLKNKEMILQITNLDKNEPIHVEKYHIETIENGEWSSLQWPKKYFEGDLLKPGNYSVRIVIDTIMSEKRFIFPKERK